MGHTQTRYNPLHWFAGFGVELEYMIVDRDTYGIRSIADRVLAQAAGDIVDEVNCGAMGWSNELVLHVLELKTNGPVRSLTGLESHFLEHVHRINNILTAWNACLMPTAAHPFVNPDLETKLWPHSGHEVYDALNHIFGCKGHGWRNLQSAHLNLPFYDDKEFALLHAAIRLILPLIPSLAAASPFLDGQDTGKLDSRLAAYVRHCVSVPSAAGDIIPEAVSSQAQYRTDVFDVIYKDLRDRNAPAILFNEWVNARGAIARFDRQTIEIRLVDMQECPVANIAIMNAIKGTVQQLTEKHVDGLKKSQGLSSQRLFSILEAGIKEAEHAVVDDSEYLHCLGMNEPSLKAGEIWRHLIGRFDDIPPNQVQSLDLIFEQGTLATRMRQVTGPVTRDSLKSLCQTLCDCLQTGQMLQI